MVDFIVNGAEYALIVLQAILLFFLLTGTLRSYIVLFLYSAVDLVASVAEISVSRTTGRASPLYRNLYWTNEILLDLLLFVLVIVLIRRAAGNPALRSAAEKILPIVIGASIILPFIYGHQPMAHTARGETVLAGGWFIVAGQVLNFGGAIMNLVLWSALLASQRRDAQLLTVSAGLGIAVTGQAIYYGIRILTAAASELRSFEDLLLAATHIAGVAIWCWAFRPSARPAEQP